MKRRCITGVALWLAAGALAGCGGGGCGAVGSGCGSHPTSRQSRHASPARERATPGAARSPSPWAPGSVSLRFAGALERSVEGKGPTSTQCERGRLWLMSADVEGPAHAGEWFLEVDLVDRTVSLGLPESSGRYRARAIPKNDRRLHRERKQIELDVSLPGTDGAAASEQVRVLGTIHCPEPVPVEPYGEPLIERIEHVTGGQVRPFFTYDFGRAKEPRALSVLVERDEVYDVAERLRRALDGDLLVFVGTTRNLAGGVPSDAAEIVVARGHRQVDILRIARTDAVNYGLGTEALVHAVRALNRDYGVRVFEASTESLGLEFSDLSEDQTPTLARHLYELCPDVVDQGFGTLEALEQVLREQRAVVLWWD